MNWKRHYVEGLKAEDAHVAVNKKKPEITRRVYELLEYPPHEMKPLFVWILYGEKVI